MWSRLLGGRREPVHEVPGESALDVGEDPVVARCVGKVDGFGRDPADLGIGGRRAEGADAHGRLQHPPVEVERDVARAPVEIERSEVLGPGLVLQEHALVRQCDLVLDPRALAVVAREGPRALEKINGAVGREVPRVNAGGSELSLICMWAHRGQLGPSAHTHSASGGRSASHQ